MKKILAVVMVLSMIMAPFMTISVGAAEGLNYSTTVGYEDYFAIKSANDIALIASYVADDTEGTNKYYIENDITLAATTNTSYISEFKGILDGGNHVITLSINNTSTDAPAGLIGTVTAESTITNVVTKGSISVTKATKGTGAVVGKASAKLTMDNCTNYANIASSKKAGGILGDSVAGTKYADTQMTNLTNYGDVSGTYWMGGISAYAYAYTDYINCQNYGDISGSQYIGGIVGNRSSNWGADIKYCQNFGDITAKSSYGGGISGWFGIDGTAITGCLNAGTVTSAASTVGGISSLRTGGYAKNWSVDTSINVGKVNYTGAATVTLYSLVGIGTATASEYSTYAGNATNSVYLPGTAKDADVNATAYTTADAALEILNTTTAGVFEVDETVDFGYPTLTALDLTTKNVTFNVGEGSVNKDATEKVIYGMPYQFTITAPANYAPVVTATTASGSTTLEPVSGTTYEVEVLEDTTITATYKFDIDSLLTKDANDYYEINNKTEFGYINEYPGEKYILKSDIVLDATTDSSYIPTFSGELNGNSKSVTININTEEADGTVGTGLIGKVKEGSNIHDLTIKGSLTALNKKGWTGALAGVLSPDASKDATTYITNITNEAEVKAVTQVGGIIGATGDNWNWEIVEYRNLVNKGNVTAVEDGTDNGGRLAAGIIMSAGKNSKLYGCINYGTITAEDFCAAGIVNNGGYGNGGSIVYGCMNFGKIDGTSQSAGIVVVMNGHKIKDCLNAGEIVAKGDQVAGILGYVNNTTNAELVDCINVGKITTSDGSKVAPIVGKNSANIPTVSGNIYVDHGMFEDTTGATTFTTVDAALTALNTDSSTGYTYAAAPVDVEFPYPVISGPTLATKTVTFNVTGNGSVDLGASAKVIMGTSVPFKVTPADGNYIETVRLNNKTPLAGYVATPVTLVTPSVTDDLTIDVKFTTGTPETDTVTTSKVYPEVLTENGVKVQYMFARLAKDFGEFGMLITTENLGNAMTVETQGVKKAEGVTAPNVLGQFGIRFVGGAEGAEASLPAGKYYVRPYAIYNGITKYGEVVSFEVE